MKTIMLCAGYATRLYPLTKDKPKPLLPLAEKPIINYLLEKVLQVPEMTEIYVVTNDKFAGAFEDWRKKSYPKEKISVINDGTTTNENRLGAIRDIEFVLKQKKIDDDLLILASDNYFDFNLAEFVKRASENRPNATIAVYDICDLELAKQYGLVTINPKGRITAFLEKPQNPTTTLASTGVYFYPKESLRLFDEYLKTNQNPDAPGHYVKWLTERAQVFAFSFEGTWYDIGDFASYEKADKALRKGVK